jgi:hypothetical protein
VSGGAVFFAFGEGEGLLGVCLGVHNDKIESSEGEADEEVDDVGTLTELFMEEVCESVPKAQVKTEMSSPQEGSEDDQENMKYYKGSASYFVTIGSIVRLLAAALLQRVGSKRKRSKMPNAA